MYRTVEKDRLGDLHLAAQLVYKQKHGYLALFIFTVFFGLFISDCSSLKIFFVVCESYSRLA